ncbi:hypothetical protein KR009_001414 [Drosophila setifemur]|nr:hypothetical protein KR009_001414 [Drosophila setifemur]
MSWPGKLLIVYENFTTDLPTLQNGKHYAGCTTSCDCQCKCCKQPLEKYVAFCRESGLSGDSSSASSGGGDVQKMMRFRSADMLILLQVAQSRENFWTNQYFKVNLQEDFQAICRVFEARNRFLPHEKLEEILDTVTTGYRRAVGQLTGSEANGALRPQMAAAFSPGLRCACQDCRTLPWRKLLQVEQHQKEHSYWDNFHCRICYRRFYIQHSLVSHLSKKMGSPSDELLENRSYQRWLEEQKVKKQEKQPLKQVEELVVIEPRGLQLDFVEETGKEAPVRRSSKLSKCPLCQRQYRFTFSHQLHQLLRHRKQEEALQVRYSCSTCPSSFLTRTFLKKHQQRIRFSCRLRYRPFKCRNCRWRFQLWSSLKSHVTRMHQRRKPCLICQLPTLGRCCCAHSSKECNDAIRKHREKIREQRGPLKVNRKQPKPRCEICGLEFGNNFYLRDHLNKKHLKRRNFTCEICGAAFYSQGLMQTHRKAVHLMMHTVHCQICDLTIKARGNYQRHLKSKRHLDELSRMEQQEEDLRDTPDLSDTNDNAKPLDNCEIQELEQLQEIDSKSSCTFQKPDRMDFCEPCGHAVVGQILRHCRSNKHKQNVIKYSEINKTKIHL